MSTIKNQRCFTEATASARLILATGLKGGNTTEPFEIPGTEPTPTGHANKRNT